MKHSFRIGIFLMASILLSSCTSFFLGLYGMKSPRQLNDKQLQKEAKRQGIPIESVFRIDTNYWAYLEKFDSTFNVQVKNHSQPLQALYFDHNGQLFRFYVNCYAGGFPNLKWNRIGGFNQFPPLPQAPIDSMFQLNDISALITPLSKVKADPFGDTSIVVFWNRMMGRQSKRFIRFVKENAQLSQRAVQIRFVNTDELFLNALD